MRVRILGGHGGVAPGFRATSYLINNKLLIDAGSCATAIPIAEQMAIDTILISHAHLDHIKDLGFICDNCFGMKDGEFKVFCAEPVRKAILDHIFNWHIWPDFSRIPNEESAIIKFNQFVSENMFEQLGFKITPIPVNHSAGAHGFIIEKADKAVIFTQDTGPTEKIWEIGKSMGSKIKGIFTEVSFPNRMQKVADDSQHHTAQTIKEEIKKMPPDVPIFLGHLKPNFQDELIDEINSLDSDRIQIMGVDDTSYIF